MFEPEDNSEAELDLKDSSIEPKSDADINNDEQGSDLSFLDGEEDKSSSIKAESRKKALEGQVNSAQSQIDSGEKSVEDFPEYLQKELTVSAEPIQFNEEAIVEKAVQRIEDKKDFDSLKAELKAMELTSEQTKLLQDEYQELKTSGLTNKKALSTAVRLTGLTSQIEQARQDGIQLGRMGLTPNGQVQSLKQPKEADPLEMTDDDFLKWSNSKANSSRYKN